MSKKKSRGRLGRLTCTVVYECVALALVASVFFSGWFLGDRFGRYHERQRWHEIDRAHRRLERIETAVAVEKRDPPETPPPDAEDAE